MSDEIKEDTQHADKLPSPQATVAEAERGLSAWEAIKRNRRAFATGLLASCGAL